MKLEPNKTVKFHRGLRRGLLAAVVIIAGLGVSAAPATQAAASAIIGLPGISVELCGGGSTVASQATATGPASTGQSPVATKPAKHRGPSETDVGFLNFFTGGGAYMPRTHCLVTPEGNIDWPWVAALILLSATVIAAYLKIFVFWMRSYFAEQARDRNSKLFDLAIMFLLCATCGYAMSILMFAWPAYRLLAIFLVVLNVVSWKFCCNLQPFAKALAANRLERELREATESRATELERLVIVRTTEANRLAQIAQRTANAVVITDPRGHIEWVNAGFTRVTGYTLDEVIGRKPGHILQGAKSDKAEAERMSGAIRRGEAVSAEIVNYAKSGRNYIVSVEIEPLRDAAGVLTGFMAIESDVTAQRRAEASIRETKDMLARTSAMASVGGWEMDTASGKVLWSDEVYRIHTVPHGTPMSLDAVLDLYPPGEREKKAAVLHAAAAKGASWDLELWRLNPAGKKIWLRSRGEAVLEKGRVVCLRAAVQDVTEQHEARAAAEEANRTKSEFLANMSHEIRTPLTAILGFTDLLREDGNVAMAPKSRLETIDTIKNAGNHLLTIINDILDLSKIEAGKMTVEAIETPVVRLLADVQSMMGPRAENKNVTLCTRLRTPLPELIVGDPTRLRQILMNLVGNAAKFTDRGAIVVSAEVRESQGISRLVVEVDDTGPGMTIEQADRLFAPFSQADASVTRHHGGTGLGLTISRRLARLMGGEVVLARTAPGQGSCFRLDIPLVAMANARQVTTLNDFEPDRVQENVAPVAKLTGRILLAEDGADNQRLVSFHLRKAGAEVEVADNGKIALAMIERASRAGKPFDLLLTDMQMPEMDGYTLASTLRRGGSSIAIIALTAHAMSEDRQKCVDAGCDDYASKPVDKALLLESCGKWMGKPSAVRMSA